MKKVPEGRFGFCNDTHVAYDKAIMPGCVEEYSFASHSLGGVICIVSHGCMYEHQDIYVGWGAVPREFGDLDT